MAWHDGPDVWREGPDDRQGMGEWERAAYAYAKEAALTRGTLLKAAGLGLGGVLLGPVAAARGSGAATLLAEAGTLVLARQAPSLSIDPQTRTNGPNAEVIAQVFDPLIYLGARGEIYPGLATAWSFNEKGTILKFRLRRGVSFHDGTPLNAGAVKASFDRWRDPKTASETAASFLGPLADVAAADEFTVAFRFTKPFAPVFASFSSAWAGIVSPTAVKKYGDQFGRNPVGTGPYRFVEWTADDTIKLARNSAHKWSTPFYKAPNGKPLARGPVLDTVEYRLIPEESTRLAAFGSREIDMIYGLNAVPSNRVPALKRQAGVQVVQVPFEIAFMVLNVSRAPLKDARTRQALSYAIDRTKLVALALNGQGRPGTSLLPSLFPDHDPTVAKYNRYDPDRARSLLKAAGQGKFSIDYVLASDLHGAADRRAAQLIQQDFSKIGVKLNIKLLPLSEFVAQTISSPVEEKPHAWRAGTAPSISPDGGQNIAFLWGRRGADPTGYFRLAADPQLDRLLEQQAATLNRKKRRSLLASIQRRMATRGYSLPLYELPSFAVAQRNVRNIHMDWLGQIHLQELTRS